MNARNTTYRLAVGVALAAACILVGLSLGVGIIGRDGDPANLMHFGVLGVGITGALAARSRPGGMARALFAAAVAQTSGAAFAVIAGLGDPWSGALELSLLNGFFVALFLVLRSGGSNGAPHSPAAAGRQHASASRPRPSAGPSWRPSHRRWLDRRCRRAPEGRTRRRAADEAHVGTGVSLGATIAPPPRA